MNDYLAALLFFLPAALANATPVFLNKTPGINQWNTPLDFGKQWRGRRLLGDNKRLRGLVGGVFIGGLSEVLISHVNINTVTPLAPFWVGCILGFGALAGDAVESFIKRQKHIKPGQSWFPFDQTDYIFGALICILPFVPLPVWAVLTIIVVFFALHLISTYIGYLIGMRDKPI